MANSIFILQACLQSSLFSQWSRLLVSESVTSLHGSSSSFHMMWSVQWLAFCTHQVSLSAVIRLMWCDVMWCHHHGSFCGHPMWWMCASRFSMSLIAQLSSTVSPIILPSDVLMMYCTRVSYCTIMSVQGPCSSRLACKPCYNISPLLHFTALVKLLASLCS